MENEREYEGCTCNELSKTVACVVQLEPNETFKGLPAENTESIPANSASDFEDLKTLVERLRAEVLLDEDGELPECQRLDRRGEILVSY